MPTDKPSWTMCFESAPLDAHLTRIGARKFHDQWIYCQGEYAQTEAMNRQLQDYVERLTAGRKDEPERPLSLAVFGPPGSGKSTLVRLMAEPFKMHFAEINLTQIASPHALARKILQEAEQALKTEKVPLVFIDEFDAKLGGAPLGWLSWFLAPMQDGLFFVDDVPYTLRRAVYVFAGGTAGTYRAFGAGDLEQFRLAKGPDFVSRLHAYLDVRGINHSEAREWRRAMPLSAALKSYDLEEELRDNLVNVGRYRHGQRSFYAVIELIKKKAADHRITHADLPEDFILDMYADRGPLDPQIIGGLVGLSGGGTHPSPPATLSGGNDDTGSGMRDEFWRRLAEALWQLGAGIAYAGNWCPGGLTELLLPAGYPMRLNPSAQPETRLEIHAQQAPTSPPAKDVSVIMVPQPMAAGASPALLNSAWLFAQRWQNGTRSRARVILSGKRQSKIAIGEKGYSGRMPGIVEEAMIALVLKQPLYVIGAFDGAAQIVGECLGLSVWNSAQVTRTAAVSAGDASSKDSKQNGQADSEGQRQEAVAEQTQASAHDQPNASDPGGNEDQAQASASGAADADQGSQGNSAKADEGGQGASSSGQQPSGGSHSGVPLQEEFERFSYLFRPPGFENLPLTCEEALAFVSHHAIGSPGWTDNGLSVEENRRLFAMELTSEEQQKKAIELIEKGLLRLFDR